MPGSIILQYMSKEGEIENTLFNLSYMECQSHLQSQEQVALHRGGRCLVQLGQLDPPPEEPEEVSEDE